LIIICVIDVVYNSVMELANHLDQKTTSLLSQVRQAEQSDTRAILNLLRNAPARHVHVDWHVPADWLGTPGFAVCVDPAAAKRPPIGLFGGLREQSPRLLGCLAIAADPLPAAWVRAAAADGRDPIPVLSALMDHVVAELRQEPISQIGWLLTETWPAERLASLSFRHLIQIETHVKESLEETPVATVAGLQIRPVRSEEMGMLAEIEAAAFEPLWRHSATSLALAQQQAASFDVAVLDGQLAGFQFSTRSPRGAHLARMTVHPAHQGRGIGAALLAEAISQYRAEGLRRVTLNTQVDNVASKRLYGRFGFRPSGEEFPVWVREISR
jgi:ribosomal-protein-alanine N-acetyltransferase